MQATASQTDPGGMPHAQGKTRTCHASSAATCNQPWLRGRKGSPHKPTCVGPPEKCCCCQHRCRAANRWLLRSNTTSGRHTRHKGCSRGAPKRAHMTSRPGHMCEITCADGGKEHWRFPSSSKRTSPAPKAPATLNRTAATTARALQPVERNKSKPNTPAVPQDVGNSSPTAVHKYQHQPATRLHAREENTRGEGTMRQSGRMFAERNIRTCTTCV